MNKGFISGSHDTHALKNYFKIAKWTHEQTGINKLIDLYSEHTHEGSQLIKALLTVLNEFLGELDSGYNEDLSSQQAVEMLNSLSEEIERFKDQTKNIKLNQEDDRSTFSAAIEYCETCLKKNLTSQEDPIVKAYKEEDNSLREMLQRTVNKGPQ